MPTVGILDHQAEAANVDLLRQELPDAEFIDLSPLVARGIDSMERECIGHSALAALVVNADISSIDSIALVERVLARRNIPIILLSFSEDPIEATKEHRLLDTNGIPFLNHPSFRAFVSRALRPQSPRQIATRLNLLLKDKTAGQSSAANELRLALQMAGDSRIRSRTRHDLKNLQAALRMLDGGFQIGAINSEQYQEILRLLKERNQHDKNKGLLDVIGEHIPQMESRDVQMLASNSNPARRLLLIDDQARSCAWHEILTHLCGPLGVELKSEESVSEGTAKIETWEPDLVLLDLHLPDAPTNVVDVLEAVRKVDSQVPVIIFSSDLCGPHVRTLLNRGGVDYFFKELEESGNADVAAYATKFQATIRKGLDRIVPSLLRAVIDILLPAYGDEQGEDHVAQLLQAAADSIADAEASLFVSMGATSAVRRAVPIPRPGFYAAAWSHIDNLFEEVGRSYTEHDDECRRKLPELVRLLRNYVAHLEETDAPHPDFLDAVLFILAVALFASDLRWVSQGNGGFPQLTPDETRRLATALARLLRECGTTVLKRIVLSDDVVEIFKFAAVGISAERDLGLVLKAKCDHVGKVVFARPLLRGYRPVAYAAVTDFCFPSGTSNLRPIHYEHNQASGGLILYACYLLVLERLARMDNTMRRGLFDLP